MKKTSQSSATSCLVAIPLFTWRDNLPRLEEVPHFDRNYASNDPDIEAFRRSALQRQHNDPVHCAILLSMELDWTGKHDELIGAGDIEGSDPLEYCSESFLDRAYAILVAKTPYKPILRKDWHDLVRSLTRRVVYLSCEHPYVHYANRIVPNMDKAELRTLSEDLLVATDSFDSVLDVQKHLIDLAGAETNFYAAILKDMESIPQHFSCFPTAQLEWPNADLLNLYDNGNSNTHCTIMPVLESEDRDTAYQQRTGASCQCTRCRYELVGGRDIVSEPLARHYMAKGDLKAAKELYEAALSHATETTKLDIRHALGAIALGNGNFMEAQHIWQEAIKAGGDYAANHTGLRLQREKMVAYSYLKESNSFCLKPVKEFTVESPIPGAFTAQLLDVAQCRRIIEQTESRCEWSSGRHYAVPTRDIPIHTIPDLLQWFRDELMDKTINPLLTQCFGRERYYVHDAFFVKYEAATESNYLSLHTDESTHSFVLALNDNFDGGGTYFHREKKLVRLSAGSILAFQGDKLFHGGKPVTSGTRYILAAFLYQESRQADGERSTVAETLRNAKKQKTEFSFSFLASKGD